jgi:glycine cleavage system aminomethyltransferase T/NADPH-dependent 2,4-dienoyl-CoA reductase/sulfur reductase-like enzyme
MTRGPFRLPSAGRIDRSRRLEFSLDGRRMSGFHGDTLASALLGNGVQLVGRSFKYHRPRGFVAAGVEEPNGLFTLDGGGRTEPNVAGTVTDLFEGLEARSQNAWPSVHFDLQAVNSWVAPLLMAGFYYKTFMGPTRGSWMFYEPLIRRAAGLGRGVHERDPDRYESRHAFTDVLVVGAGPAGLSAALAAGRSGARVLLVEQDSLLGGNVLSESATSPAAAWCRQIERELGARPNVEILRRTTAFGLYDSGTVALVERREHLRPDPIKGHPRQVVMTVRARTIVFATGALERPLVFGNNDRPGVMLASAARSYLNRFAVACGRRAVVATNNDSAYATAFDLAAVGIAVTIVDCRGEVDSALVNKARALAIGVQTGAAVLEVVGRRSVKGVIVAGVAGVTEVRSVGGALDVGWRAVPTNARRLDCDLVCMSGGWSPVVHLTSHGGIKPRYREDIGAFVPGGYGVDQFGAGALTGSFGLEAAIEEGVAAGRAASSRCGCEIAAHEARPPAWEAMALPHEARPPLLEAKATPHEATHPLLEAKATRHEAEAPRLEEGSAVTLGGGRIGPVWQSTSSGRHGPAFVDFQNDVTVKDLKMAHQEGYHSVEHLKRYTTLGMGTDQGKTSNINALGIMAHLREVDIPTAGTTTFRPPFTPVTIGALAGRNVGQHFRPIRLSPLNDWHVAHGGEMIEAGPWRRAWWYRWAGSSVESAYVEEMRLVRRSVGLSDISTLGKIDVRGPDAAQFLNRVYVNGFDKLAVGKARYGVMLADDGTVLDDGTTTRLSDTHYFMTTTTAHAEEVLSWLEFLLQTAWTELKVDVTSVTDEWAGMSVAGPRARAALELAFPEHDFSDAAIPHMGCLEIESEGIPLRVIRLSFSGELAYELYTPADYGVALWEHLLSSGMSLGMKPYGLEALASLRIEKGHVAGLELDHRNTLDDLGLGKMARTEKAFVGRELRERPLLRTSDRWSLVGIESLERETMLRGGSILFSATDKLEGHGRGYITSATWSIELERFIALGLYQGGLKHVGEEIVCAYPLKGEKVKARIVSPMFIDPNGARLRV